MIKKVSLNGNIYTIKELSPDAFLNSDIGVPFQLFCAKEEESREEALRRKIKPEVEDSADEDAKIIETITLVLKVGCIDVNKKQFCVDKFMETTTDVSECFALIDAIFAHSLTLFTSVRDMSKQNAHLINKMATDYGKTPIEIMRPTGGYTDLDAYMFNSFVFVTCLNDQAASIKKANKAAVRQHSKLGLRANHG